MNLKFTDLILHVPKFLSDKECDLVINEFNHRDQESMLEHCPEASSNMDTYSTYKRIILNSGTDSYDLISKSTETIIKRYMTYLDTFDSFHVGIKGSMLYSHMYRVLRYDTGTKIHPHTDHDPYIYGSCTFNLNDEYEGGDFVFFKGKHKIKLGKGDAMIWPADFFWVHEVDEITKGVRYSTNSFLMNIPPELKLEVDDFVKKRISSNLTYPAPYDVPRKRVSKL